MLRVSEVYQSVQGEGPNVGTPTTFVRFGGCNLRCPGWPCDTQHAIDPKFRKEWAPLDPHELAAKVPGWPTNVCLTGGEPFLQSSKEMNQFVVLLKNHGHRVECFSNGTVKYPEDITDMVSFVVDWKLPGSGEDTDKYEKVRSYNLRILRMGWQYQYCKFTVASEEDYVAALGWYDHFTELDEPPFTEYYVGAVWDKVKEAQLVDWMLKDKRDWMLNVQIHNHIWDRSQRGI